MSVFGGSENPLYMEKKNDETKAAASTIHQPKLVGAFNPFEKY